MLPPFTVWAPVKSGLCVLGCNTNYIPIRTPLNELAVPRTDGTWGPHDYTMIPQDFDPEAPYLAWCPRRSQGFGKITIIDFIFAADHYVPNPGARVLGGLKKEILSVFHAEVESIVRMCESAAQTVEVHSPTVHPPEQALQNMRQSIVYLNLHDIYLRDCREGVETLRRNTREVLSYVLWARTFTSTPIANVSPPMRGSVTKDLPTYMYLRDNNVPAWLVVDYTGSFDCDPVPFTRLKDMCTLATWRDVQTKDATCVDWEDISTAIYKLKHTKPLFFYPPVVGHQTGFERTARGYMKRQDVANPDKEYQRRLTALQKTVAPQVTLLHAQKLKSPAFQVFHKIYKAQIQDTFTCANWSSTPFIECQHALLQTRWSPPDPPRIQEPDQLLYIMPPTFIFTRARDDPGQPTAQDYRLHNMFFIWVCIRRKCLARPELWCKTTKVWKQVLSGAYFRDLHPHNEKMDVNRFWKHGWGPMFQDCDDDDPVPYYLGERLAPSAFSDRSLRKVIVYDVSLISIKFQFEKTHRMLLGDQFQDLGEHLFKRDPSLIDFSSHPNPLSSSWMVHFEMYISRWPQFRASSGDRLPLIEDGMPGEQDHRNRVVAHLRTYFQGVQDCLRTLPAMFFPYPPVDKWVIDACASL